MRFLAAMLIALQYTSCVAAEPQAFAAPVSDLRLRLSDQMIRQAVREAIAETREHPRRHEADVLSADRYQRFSSEFHEAKVPDCLHPDALKRQPPAIGPIGFTGLYAIPFVLLAKVRGKCL
jgi:hypothetical protein